MRRKPKIIRTSQLKEHISKMVMEQSIDLSSVDGGVLPDDPYELEEIINRHKRDRDHFKDLIDRAARNITNAKSYSEISSAIEIIQDMGELWVLARVFLERAERKLKSLR